MSLVFMTQIGLVAIVEQAPPLREAYTFARNQLSDHCRLVERPQSDFGRLLTSLSPEKGLRFVVNGQIDSPSRNITQQHRSKSTIHAPKTFLFPYSRSSPRDAMVSSSGDLDTIFGRPESSLSL